jgi:hypothetical protein
MSQRMPMIPDSCEARPGTNPGDPSGISTAVNESDAIPLWPMLRILGLILAIGLGAIAWSSQMCNGELPRDRPRLEHVRDRTSGVEFSLIDEADGARVRTQQQRKRLHEYAWIPGEPGFARIPIEEAMAAWLATEQR